MNGSTGARRAYCLALVAAAVAMPTAAAFADAYAQIGPLGALRPPPATGISSWILAQQAQFYRALSGLIHAAKTDGSAYWGLMGVSFIYGIFHAAGPGHGKAVISSYLLANEETWRRGIALSFASALLQALTAVVIVAVVAVLIGATAKMMGDTVRVIEIVSYALIALVGLRLLWVKGRGFLHALHALRLGPQAHANAANGAADCRHHDHPHGHDHTHDGDSDHSHLHRHADNEEDDVLPWGHAHAPEPEQLAGPGGWRRGLSAIVAVGLRPCSGAIIVLVFALAQGLFLAGVASTLVMGLGTAITVAAIATLAVIAKAAAGRFAATRAGYGSLLLRGVEVGAALLVTSFGVLLLTGYVVSERMGVF